MNFFLQLNFMHDVDQSKFTRQKNINNTYRKHSYLMCEK